MQWQAITLLAGHCCAGVSGVVAVGGKPLVMGAGADGGKGVRSDGTAALAQDRAGRHLHTSRTNS